MSKSSYTYPHKSRAAKIGYLCSVGGYSSRHTNWPIAFDVATYRADLSLDNLWNRYSVGHMPFDSGTATPTVLAAYYDLYRKGYAKLSGSLWGWGQEAAASCLADDDMYRMLPNGTTVEASLSLQGRGGKHLVISAFGTKKLEGLNSADLESELMWQTRTPGHYYEGHYTLLRCATWKWSTAELDLLYRYVRQCEVDFTVNTASALLESEAAYALFSQINAEWDIEVDIGKEHALLVASAQRLQEFLQTNNGGALLEDFRALCKAVGVTTEEVTCDYS